MPLKQSATRSKQKLEIFFVNRPLTCRKLHACFWFLQHNKSKFVDNIIAIILQLSLRLLVIAIKRNINNLKCLLTPIRVAKITECVRKYMEEISQNLHSLSPYQPCSHTVFSLLLIMIKQVKSSSQISRYQQVNKY